MRCIKPTWSCRIELGVFDVVGFEALVGWRVAFGFPFDPVFNGSEPEVGSDEAEARPSVPDEDGAVTPPSAAR